jgi:xanthosine utilization system XapX-like protein
MSSPDVVDVVGVVGIVIGDKYYGITEFDSE